VEGDQEDRGQARSLPTRPEPRYSHSLQRGLSILGCFTPERPLLGIAEIADMLGMSRPTTHRYVSTLVKQGYLKRDPSRRYRLDLGTIDLGMGTLSAMGLCRHARPHLEALIQRSDHTAAIAVLDGLQILVLDAVTRPAGRQRTAPADVKAGKLLPTYCTGMGKVLLAHLPRAQQLKRIAQTDLRKVGPKTITDGQELLKQLDRIRRASFALNDEESAAGTCAIAAPVRNEVGDVVAAVSVIARGGASDIEDLEALERPLALTAERISQRLGWDASSA
jgi:IclR family transcriptional regulator, pca regulon regulatory protein